MLPDDFIIELLTLQETQPLEQGWVDTVWNVVYPTLAAMLQNEMLISSFPIVIGSIGLVSGAIVFRSYRSKKEPMLGLQPMELYPSSISEKESPRSFESSPLVVVSDSERTYADNEDNNIDFVKKITGNMQWQYSASESQASVYVTMSKGNSSTILGDSIVTDIQSVNNDDLSKSDKIETKSGLRENVFLCPNAVSKTEAIEYQDPSTNIIILKRSIFSKTNVQKDNNNIDNEILGPVKKKPIQSILIKDNIHKSETPSAKFVSSFVLSDGKEKNVEKKTEIPIIRFPSPLVRKFQTAKTKHIEEKGQNLRYHTYSGAKLLTARAGCKKCPVDGKCIIHRSLPDMRCQYSPKLIQEVERSQNDIVIEKQKSIKPPKSQGIRHKRSKKAPLSAKSMVMNVGTKINSPQKKSIPSPRECRCDGKIHPRREKVLGVKDVSGIMREANPMSLYGYLVKKNINAKKKRIKSPYSLSPKKSQCNQHKGHKISTMKNPNVINKPLRPGQKVQCDAFSNDRLFRPLPERGTSRMQVLKKCNDKESHYLPCRSLHLTNPYKKNAQMIKTYYPKLRALNKPEKSSSIERQPRLKPVFVDQNHCYQKTRLNPNLENLLLTSMKDNRGYKGYIKGLDKVKNVVDTPNTYDRGCTLFGGGEFKSKSYKLPNRGMKSLRSFLDEREEGTKVYREKNVSQRDKKETLDREPAVKVPWTKASRGCTTGLNTNKKAKVGGRKGHCQTNKNETSDGRNSSSKKPQAGHASVFRSPVKQIGKKSQGGGNDRNLPSKCATAVSTKGRQSKLNRLSSSDYQANENRRVPFTAEKVVLNFTDLQEKSDESDPQEKEADPSQDLLNLSSEWNDILSTELDNQFLGAWFTGKGIENSESLSTQQKRLTSQHSKPVPQNDFSSRKYPTGNRKPPCYPSTNANVGGNGKITKRTKYKGKASSISNSPSNEHRSNTEVNTNVFTSDGQPKKYVKLRPDYDHSKDKCSNLQPIQVISSTEQTRPEEPLENPSLSSVDIGHSSVYSSSGDLINSPTIKKQAGKRDDTEKSLGKRISSNNGIRRKRKLSCEKSWITKFDNVSDMKLDTGKGEVSKAFGQNLAKRSCTVLSERNRNCPEDKLCEHENVTLRGTFLEGKKNAEKIDTMKRSHNIIKKSNLTKSKDQTLSNRFLKSLNALRKETIASKNKTRPALTTKKDQSSKNSDKGNDTIQKQAKGDANSASITVTKDEQITNKSKGLRDNSRVLMGHSTVPNKKYHANSKAQKAGEKRNDNGKGIAPSKLKAKTKSPGRWNGVGFGDNKGDASFSMKGRKSKVSKSLLHKTNISKPTSSSTDEKEQNSKSRMMKFSGEDSNKEKKAFERPGIQNRTMKIQYCPVLFRTSSMESIKTSEQNQHGLSSRSKETLNSPLGNEKLFTHKVIDTTLSIFTESDLTNKPTSGYNIKNKKGKKFVSRKEKGIKSSPFSKCERSKEKNKQNKTRPTMQMDMIKAFEYLTITDQTDQKLNSQNIPGIYTSDKQRNESLVKNNKYTCKEVSSNHLTRNQKIKRTPQYILTESDSFESLSLFSPKEQRSSTLYGNEIPMQYDIEKDEPLTFKTTDPNVNTGTDLDVAKNSTLKGPIKNYTKGNCGIRDMTSNEIAQGTNQTTENTGISCENGMPRNNQSDGVKKISKQVSQTPMPRNRTITIGQCPFLVQSESSESLSLIIQEQYGSKSISSETLSRYLRGTYDKHRMAEDTNKEGNTDNVHLIKCESPLCDKKKPMSSIKRSRPMHLTKSRDTSQPNMKNDTAIQKWNFLSSESKDSIKELGEAQPKFRENGENRATSQKTTNELRSVTIKHCPFRFQSDSLEGIVEQRALKTMDNKMQTCDLENDDLRVFKINDMPPHKTNYSTDTINEQVIQKDSEHCVENDNISQGQSNQISKPMSDGMLDGEKTLHSKCMLIIDKSPSSQGFHVGKPMDVFTEHPSPLNWLKFEAKSLPVEEDGILNSDLGKNSLVESEPTSERRVQSNPVSRMKGKQQNKIKMKTWTSQESLRLEKKRLTNRKNLASKEHKLGREAMSNIEKNKICRDTFVIERHLNVQEALFERGESEHIRKSSHISMEQLALKDTDTFELETSPQQKFSGVNHTPTVQASMIPNDNHAITEITNGRKKRRGFGDALACTKADRVEKKSILYSLFNFDDSEESSSKDNELIRQSATACENYSSSVEDDIKPSNPRNCDPGTHLTGTDQTDDVPKKKNSGNDKCKANRTETPSKCQSHTLDCKLVTDVVTQNKLEEAADNRSKLSNLCDSKLERVELDTKRETNILPLLFQASEMRDYDQGTKGETIYTFITAREGDKNQESTGKKELFENDVSDLIATKTCKTGEIKVLESVNSCKTNTLLTHSTSNHPRKDSLEGCTASNTTQKGYPNRPYERTVTQTKLESPVSFPQHDQDKPSNLTTLLEETFGIKHDYVVENEIPKGKHTISKTCDRIKMDFSEIKMFACADGFDNQDAFCHKEYNSELIVTDDDDANGDEDDNLALQRSANKERKPYGGDALLYGERQYGFQTIDEDSIDVIFEDKRDTQTIGQYRLLEVTCERATTLSKESNPIFNIQDKSSPLKVTDDEMTIPSDNAHHEHNTTGKVGVSDNRRGVLSREEQHRSLTLGNGKSVEVTTECTDTSSARKRLNLTIGEKDSSIKVTSNENTIPSEGRQRECYIWEKGSTLAIKGNDTLIEDKIRMSQTVGMGSPVRDTDKKIVLRTDNDHSHHDRRQMMRKDSSLKVSKNSIDVLYGLKQHPFQSTDDSQSSEDTPYRTDKHLEDKKFSFNIQDKVISMRLTENERPMQSEDKQLASYIRSASSPPQAKDNIVYCDDIYLQNNTRGSSLEETLDNIALPFEKKQPSCNVSDAGRSLKRTYNETQIAFEDVQHAFRLIDKDKSLEGPDYSTNVSSKNKQHWSQVMNMDSSIEVDEIQTLSYGDNQCVSDIAASHSSVNVTDHEKQIPFGDRRHGCPYSKERPLQVAGNSSVTLLGDQQLQSKVTGNISSFKVICQKTDTPLSLKQHTIIIQDKDRPIKVTNDDRTTHSEARHHVFHTISNKYSSPKEPDHRTDMHFGDEQHKTLDKGSSLPTVDNRTVKHSGDVQHTTVCIPDQGNLLLATGRTTPSGNIQHCNRITEKGSASQMATIESLTTSKIIDVDLGNSTLGQYKANSFSSNVVRTSTLKTEESNVFKAVRDKDRENLETFCTENTAASQYGPNAVINKSMEHRVNIRNTESKSKMINCGKEIPEDVVKSTEYQAPQQCETTIVCLEEERRQPPVHGEVGSTAMEVNLEGKSENTVQGLELIGNDLHACVERTGFKDDVEIISGMTRAEENGSTQKFVQNYEDRRLHPYVTYESDQLEYHACSENKIHNILKDKELKYNGELVRNRASELEPTLDVKKNKIQVNNVPYEDHKVNSADKKRPDASGGETNRSAANISKQKPYDVIESDTKTKDNKKLILKNVKSHHVVKENIKLFERNNEKLALTLEKTTNTRQNSQDAGKKKVEAALYKGSWGRQDLGVGKETKNEKGKNKLSQELDQTVSHLQVKSSHSHVMKTCEENTEFSKSTDKDLESLLTSEIKSAAHTVGRHRIRHFFGKNASKKRKRTRSQEPRISRSGDIQVENNKVPRLQNLKSRSCIRQQSFSHDHSAQTNQELNKSSPPCKKNQLSHPSFRDMNMIDTKESTKENSRPTNPDESKHNLKRFSTNNLYRQFSPQESKEKMSISDSRKVPFDTKFESFLKMKEKMASRILNNSVQLIKNTHESSSTEAVISENKHETLEEYLKSSEQGNSPHLSSRGFTPDVKDIDNTKGQLYSQRPFRRSGSQPVIAGKSKTKSVSSLAGNEDKPVRCRSAYTTGCRSLEVIQISEEYKSLSEKMSQLSKLISFDNVSDRTCPTIRSLKSSRSQESKSTVRNCYVDGDKKSILTGSQMNALKINEILEPESHKTQKDGLRKTKQASNISSSIKDIENTGTRSQYTRQQNRSPEKKHSKGMRKHSLKPRLYQKMSKSPKFATPLSPRKDENRMMGHTIKMSRERVKTSQSLPDDMNISFKFPGLISTETSHRNDDNFWKNGGRHIIYPDEVVHHKSSVSEASSDIDLSWADSTMESTLTWLTEKMGDGNDNHISLLPAHDEEEGGEGHESDINYSTADRPFHASEHQPNTTNQDLDANSNMYSNYFEPVNGLPSFTKSYVGDDLRAFLVRDVEEFEKDILSCAQKPNELETRIPQNRTKSKIPANIDQHDMDDSSRLSTYSAIKSDCFDVQSFENTEIDAMSNSSQFECIKDDANHTHPTRCYEAVKKSEASSCNKIIGSQLPSELTEYDSKQKSDPVLGVEVTRENNCPSTNLLAWSQRYDKAQRRGQPSWFALATPYRQCQSEIDEKEIRRRYQVQNNIIETEVQEPSTSRDTREAESYTIQRTSEQQDAGTVVETEEGTSSDSKSCDMGLDWYKPQARPVTSTSAHSMRAASYRRTDGAHLTPHNNLTDFPRQRPRPTPRLSKRKNP